MPPLPSLLGGDGGGGGVGKVEPSTKFSRREFAGKERVHVFQRESCSLYIEYEIKSEIFNDKNLFKQKFFFLS